MTICEDHSSTIVYDSLVCPACKDIQELNAMMEKELNELAQVRDEANGLANLLSEAQAILEKCVCSRLAGD